MINWLAVLFLSKLGSGLGSHVLLRYGAVEILVDFCTVTGRGETKVVNRRSHLVEFSVNRGIYVDHLLS